jgi:hypothetical protein
MRRPGGWRELQHEVHISRRPFEQKLGLVCVGRLICVVIGDVDFPVVAVFKAIGPLRSEVPIGQAATVACYDAMTNPLATLEDAFGFF